jgi:CheY-like chemotaxis protein
MGKLDQILASTGANIDASMGAGRAPRDLSAGTAGKAPPAPDRLRRVRRGGIDLVLTDLEMPEMDGFTLTRNIKSNARFGSMPVVIHSSLSGTTNEEHVKNVRADAYVAKFSAEDLSRTLRTLLRQ